MGGIGGERDCRFSEREWGRERLQIYREGFGERDWRFGWREWGGEMI